MHNWKFKKVFLAFDSSLLTICSLWVSANNLFVVINNNMNKLLLLEKSKRYTFTGTLFNNDVHNYLIRYSWLITSNLAWQNSSYTYSYIQNIFKTHQFQIVTVENLNNFQKLRNYCATRTWHLYRNNSSDLNTRMPS